MDHPLVHKVLDLGLVSEDQVKAAAKSLRLAENPSKERLAKRMVRAKLLTLYQAKRLILGRTAGLVLGPYVVTERIGKGVLCAVYRARHRCDSIAHGITLCPSRRDGPT